MSKIDCDYEWFIMNQKITKMSIQILSLLGGSVVVFTLGLLVTKVNAKLGGILMLLGVLLFFGLFIKAFINKIKRAALELDYYTDKGCELNLFDPRPRWISPNAKYIPPPTKK